MEQYTVGEGDRLRSLLALTYPPPEQLAALLLKGKDHVGSALPHLGLFKDPELTYSLRLPQWQSYIAENHAIAVLRWQDLVDRVERNREARKSLGEEGARLILSVGVDPSHKQRVLETLTLAEARRALVPAPRLVQDLMHEGMTREEAEQLVADVKAKRISPDALPAHVPPAPRASDHAVAADRPDSDTR